MLFTNFTFASEYRATVANKTITYDAPSLQAKKLHILGQGYPLEIVINNGDWIKTRDNEGMLAWVESKTLSSKRTVIALRSTQLKQAANESASIVATIEKNVILAIIESTSKNGWLKVRHRDGYTGYIQSSDVWGY